MSPNEETAVKSAHDVLPEGCKSDPASEEQLKNFESEFGSIPLDYRWYLLNCGGGVIGSEWIDGIGELPETHRKFQKGKDEGHHSLTNFFPVGWDGGGNPYGFDLDSEAIVTEDHGFGGIHREADNFYELLTIKGLIKRVEQDGDG